MVNLVTSRESGPLEDTKTHAGTRLRHIPLLTPEGVAMPHNLPYPMLLITLRGM